MTLLSRELVMLHTLCFLVCLQVPVQQETPVIQLKNANQLQILREVERRANRILHGPAKGEMILSNWYQGAEVVDELQFRTLRPVATGKNQLYLVLSPDRKKLAWHSGSEKTVQIENFSTGKSFFLSFSDSVGLPGFSPNGQYMAVGSTFWDSRAEGVGHSEIFLFDSNGKHLKTFEQIEPGALRPIFTPDGKKLVVGNRNAATRIYEIPTGKLIHTLNKKMTQEIALSPDGKTLAAGYVNGDVALWDVDTGKQLASTSTGCMEIYSVDWSPRGDLLATSGLEGSPILWNARNLEKVHKLKPADWAGQIRFSDDGQRLIVSSAERDTGRNPFKNWKITIWAVKPRN